MAKQRSAGPAVRVLIAAVAGLGAVLSPGVPAVASVPAAAEHPWHVVFADSFDGATLGPAWTAYHGRPTAPTGSTWSPDRVHVGGGVLTLSAVRGRRGTWTTGGVGAFATTARYGRFSARIRFDAGQGVWAAALLWPVRGWPPEVDYYEIFGNDARRTAMTATTHAGRRNRMERATHAANYQAWHVVQVVWSPTEIRYLVDGRLIGRVTDPSMIPRQRMWPAFQVVTGRGVGRAPDRSTPRVVRLQVDWFRISERS